MAKFAKLIYGDLTYKINGILFMVHNELGRYRNEKEYADCLEKYFEKFNINYEREKILSPSFDGELRGRNKIDFLIENKIILELKTKRFLSKEDYYQIRRYLISLNKKLGLLVNFRQRYLKPRRILNSLANEEK